MDLSAVGVGADEERIYRILLERPGFTVSELAKLTRLGPAKVKRLTDALESKGLVSRSASEVAELVPAPPELAIESLARHAQEEIDRARAEARKLTEIFRAGASRFMPSQPIELVAGQESIRHRSMQVQAGAQTEVLIFDKPPHVRPAPNESELERLAAGVRYRVVYEQRSLQIKSKYEAMQRCVAAGEQARTVPDLPMKLIVADARIALTYDATSDAVITAIVVHPSPLLEALLVTFETHWADGVPIGSIGHPGLDETDRHILQLLAAGLKDETIAREVGLSPRSVQRRVGELASALGATSRFQAGVKAVRRGWI